MADISPAVICLQETFLSKNKNITFKHFSGYHHSALEVNGVVHGGSSILVRSPTPHSQLTLNTCLQAVAIRVTLKKTITVCSLYLPPSFNITDLDELLDQLPPPVLILGDFNSHSTLWGCSGLDRRGKLIEDFLAKK